MDIYNMGYMLDMGSPENPVEEIKISSILLKQRT
jgi:hypothetical protein